MSFTSPMKGRFTSAFNLSRYITLNGRRVFSPHAGIDIAPPTAGTVGTAVYAAQGGKIVRIVRGRKLGQPASSGTVLAPGRSGDGALIQVGSGRHLYGHVNILSSLKVGSQVKTGQLIGYTNRSGIQSGPHLHFETWSSSSSSSYYNPVTLFTKAKISVGSTPKKASSGGSSSSNNGYTTANAKAIQTALKKMGYYKGKLDGSYGPMTISAVKAYQKKAKLYVDGLWGPKTQDYYDSHEGKSTSKPKPTTPSNWARTKDAATKIAKSLGYSSISRYQSAQKCPMGLKPDGIWGPATESHYRETKKMQEAMNKWKGNDLRVDGDYGSLTAARVKQVKSNNKGGTWKGSVNSNPDNAFMKMLGIGEYHNHK